MSDLFDIKSRVSLITEMQKHLEVKRRGTLYWARCPFHKENTPSFAINEEKGFFYCFGCGAGGTLINFLMNLKKYSYKETMEYLNVAYNLDIAVNKIEENFVERQRLFELNKFTCDFYYEHLSPVAINYLKNKSITKETIEKYKIGYADGNNLISLLYKNKFSPDEIKKAGISIDGNNDRLRNRLIFPIIDRNNQVIGFSGRTLGDDKPKYVNSPETAVFRKSLHLYGENDMVFGKPVIMVEGFFDVIALKNLGYDNAVGSMGTAVSEEQIEKVFRISDELYLMFDGDEGGVGGTRKGIIAVLKSLVAGKLVYVCELKNNKLIENQNLKDPYDIAMHGGKELIDNLLKNSFTLSEWIKIESQKGLIMSNPEDQAKYIGRVHEYVGLINDKTIKKTFYSYLLNKINYKENKNFPKAIKFSEKHADISVQKISIEDNIMSILFKSPDIVEEILEELIGVTFANKKYEEIRKIIIDEVTVNCTDINLLIQNLKINFSEDLPFLLNKNSFFGIILSRSYEIRYIKDSLALMSRKTSRRISVPSISSGDKKESDE